MFKKLMSSKKNNCFLKRTIVTLTMESILPGCRGFRLLEIFFKEPRRGFALREAARAAGMSASAAKKYCDHYAQVEVFSEKKIGTARVFSLNNEFYLVKQAKSLYLLSALHEAGIEKAAKNYVSMAVYGSAVNGEYDEESDIDLLVVGGKLDEGKISTIQEKLGKDLQITHLALSAWSEKKESMAAFAMQILMRHVLIGGEPV
jgi:uncharacterized protein